MAEKQQASTGEGIRMITEPSDEASERPEKSEEPVTVGTLTIRYVNDTPEITLNSGTAIPGEIIVVDSQGNPVAFYTGSALPVGPTTRGHFLPAGHSAVVPAAAVVPVVLSDRELKRDVVGVVWP